MTFPAICLVFKSKDTLYSRYSVKYRLLDYAILKQSLANKAGYKINNHNFKETRLIFFCLVKYSFQCHPDKNPEIKKKAAASLKKKKVNLYCFVKTKQSRYGIFLGLIFFIP